MKHESLQAFCKNEKFDDIGLLARTVVLYDCFECGFQGAVCMTCLELQTHV
jgi:hypothetical protein